MTRDRLATVVLRSFPVEVRRSVEVHKVLRLPRNLRTEVHKVLRLPRTLHMEVHKVLRLLPNVHFKKQLKPLIMMEGRSEHDPRMIRA